MSSLKNPVRARIKRRRPKDSVSKLAFRVSYLRRSREIYRRYLESKPWLNELYTSFLNIKPGQKIVDIGCGPGDFTRQLARFSKQKATILGIDSNEKSIRAATTDTKKARLSQCVSYELGDVYKIPLENGYADLTCCRTLLMHLTEPLKAVKEMARVTRTGGSVVVLEGGKMGAFYDSNDEEYSMLAELSEIKAEIQADAWLHSDPRRRLSDVKAELRFDYSLFKERRRKDRKYLLAGGMSNNQITSYFNRLEARTEQLLSSDMKLRNDSSLYAGTFFLVSGVKKG